MASFKRRPLILLLTGVLAVGACGGSDDSSTEAPSTDGSQALPTDTADPADPAEVEIAKDAIDAALGDLSEECKAVSLAFGAAMSSALGSPVQQGAVAEVFASIQGNLPAELKDDVDVFASAVSAFYEGQTGDAAAVDPAEFFAALEQPEVAAAAENIQTFLEESCPTLAD